MGGYPRGFVNLPMAGDLCLPRRNAFCTAANASEADCTAKSLLVAMQEGGSYAFAHKLGCGNKLQC